MRNGASNQVLVTDTVRALTAGVAPVEFVPFGSRRLKGLAQPIMLHRALPTGSVTPGRRFARPAGVPTVAMVLVGLVLAVGIGVWLITASGLLGTRSATSESSASETPGPSASVTASASASASSEPSLGPFPTDDEAALIWSHRSRFARRMPADGAGGRASALVSRPRFRHAPHDIDYVAGVDCALGGFSAGDRVWLWDLPRVTGGSSSRVPTPNEVVLLQAQRVDAVAGVCASQVPAHQAWSFGTHQGLLVCYETDTGDAVVMWTYDDETLLGKAIREDRDMASLLAWWTDVARFGPS